MLKQSTDWTKDIAKMDAPVDVFMARGADAPAFEHTFATDLDEFYTDVEEFHFLTREEVFAKYNETLTLNARRAQYREDASKDPVVRTNGARVLHDAHEVARRALAVLNCEDALKQTREYSLYLTKLYKWRHGIERLDFNDGSYRHFTRFALADYREAKANLKKTRNRLSTATRGYARILAVLSIEAASTATGYVAF